MTTSSTTSSTGVMSSARLLSTRRRDRVGLIVTLILVDVLTLAIAFRAAFYLRFEASFLESLWQYQLQSVPIQFYGQIIFWLIPLWIIIFFVFGLYDLKNLLAGNIEYSQLLNACTLAMMSLILISFFIPDFEVARGWWVLTWGISLVTTEVGRFVTRRITEQIRARGYLATRVLMVGTNEEAQLIGQQLLDNPTSGVHLIGFVDQFVETGTEILPNVPVLGKADDVAEVVEQAKIHEVIIPTSAIPREKMLSVYQALVGNDKLTIRLSSGLYEMMTTGVEVQEVAGVPLLSVNRLRLTGSDLILKRLLDIVVSLAVLPIILMIAIPFAIAIKMESPGPVIYRRRVVGIGGRQFDAYKFRTMFIDGDARLAQHPDLLRELRQNFKLKHDPRVTKVGRIIRPLSFDEFPQLINVIRGQMSLIGPRMITAKEQDKYGKWRFNLGTVKPGITGLWQVSGRSDVSYDERVLLDMHYIRNYSIWLDLNILWRTIPAVLAKKGAY